MKRSLHFQIAFFFAVVQVVVWTQHSIVLLVQGMAVPKQPMQSSRRAALAAASSFATACLFDNNKEHVNIVGIQAAHAMTEQSQPDNNKPKFRRYPQLRFIAALGDPQASSGTGAEQWGLWRDDPGPRGVFLRNYVSQIVERNNVAPAGWTFDPNDWWVEEHGLIMSTPEPLPRKQYDKTTQQVIPRKRYIVTGDRKITTVLSVYDNGRWQLEKGTLYDVTHLPCRSARYTGQAGSCQPTAAAKDRDFPVKPGAAMPPIPGCQKQDYAVLFVLGEEVL